MNDPNYAYPYAPRPSPQGDYQGPPMIAPPLQYVPHPPPLRREPGFLERCLAALRCCFLLDECCSDPSTINNCVVSCAMLNCVNLCG